MWCSFAVNLLVVTLQKKLGSGSHKVFLTENRTVGVIPTLRLGGGGGALHFFCPRAPKTLVTPLLAPLKLKISGFVHNSRIRYAHIHGYETEIVWSVVHTCSCGVFYELQKNKVDFVCPGAAHTPVRVKLKRRVYSVQQQIDLCQISHRSVRQPVGQNGFSHVTLWSWPLWPLWPFCLKMPLRAVANISTESEVSMVLLSGLRRNEQRDGLTEWIAAIRNAST